MKFTKNFFAATATALMFVATITILASCTKENDVDTLAAEQAAYAIWAYDDVINIANEAAKTQTGDSLILYKRRGVCTTVINTPGKIVVAFGGTNCLCNDGRMRRGKIIIEYPSQTFGDSGMVHTISFESFFVDDNELKGNETFIYSTIDTANAVVFNVTVDGEIDILDSVGAYTFNADITRRFAQGAFTPQYSDDVYELTGTGRGVNPFSNNYAFSIVAPIIKPVNITCKYFTQGILEVQPQGRTFRSMDFGVGDCDKKATVTIDKKEHNVDLR